MSCSPQWCVKMSSAASGSYHSLPMLGQRLVGAAMGELMSQLDSGVSPQKSENQYLDGLPGAEDFRFLAIFGVRLIYSLGHAVIRIVSIHVDPTPPRGGGSASVISIFNQNIFFNLMPIYLNKECSGKPIEVCSVMGYRDTSTCVGSTETDVNGSIFAEHLELLSDGVCEAAAVADASAHLGTRVFRKLVLVAMAGACMVSASGLGIVLGRFVEHKRVDTVGLARCGFGYQKRKRQQSSSTEANPMSLYCNASLISLGRFRAGINNVKEWLVISFGFADHQMIIC